MGRCVVIARSSKALKPILDLFCQLYTQGCANTSYALSAEFRQMYLISPAVILSVLLAFYKAQKAQKYKGNYRDFNQSYIKISLNYSKALIKEVYRG